MHCGVAFPTVIGDIAYDAKRDRATVDYVWGVWKKGDDGKIKFKPM
jgi:branched-chain amino acid transport system substrate-binding protein